MENLKKKLKTEHGTSTASNQSPTGGDFVINPSFHSKFQGRRSGYNLRSSNLSDDGHENDFIEKCLIKIFSYLSIHDMMQVKGVCKNWYEVSQQWFSRVHTLVYHQPRDRNGRLELYENDYKRKIYEKPEIHGFDDIISILHSCGRHIKFYKATTGSFEDTSAEERKKFIFQWVPKLCENIVEVQIYGDKASNTPLPFEVMAKHWKKLEKINIKHIRHSSTKTICNLLRKNKQLQTVTLCGLKTRSRLENQYFTSLPTTIEEIELGDVWFTSPYEWRNLISASKNFRSLQLLRLLGLFRLTDAVVTAIANIKSLTHLSLYDVRSCESRGTIGLIANLKGLKSLVLAVNCVFREDSIINIAESCIQLEQLEIRRGVWLTEKGMAAIAKLKNLKCLGIHVKNVTLESIISSCGSLEVLQCHEWEINNTDAIKLLEEATNLKFVYFFSCKNLTDDILSAANKIANGRMNNILYIRRRQCLSHDADIDTPYFKYFSHQIEIPLEVFPEDIKYYLRQMNANFHL